MATLRDDELSAELATLPGWSVQNGELTKSYSFSTFRDSISFVNRVADLAEDAGHHPDILISYATVTLRLSTHSEGGITRKDTELARRCDGLSS